jgi:hypothetical protein
LLSGDAVGEEGDEAPFDSTGLQSCCEQRVGPTPAHRKRIGKLFIDHLRKGYALTGM